MMEASKRWLRWAALAVSAIFVFAVIVWVGRGDAKKPELVAASLPLIDPPPSVYVAPDPSPTTSTLGTDASVSEASLRLQLFATAPGRTSREGVAVIGTHANNPQTYAVGSVLASGAVVEEIFADYVILESGGDRVRLDRVGIKVPDDQALVAATTVGGPGMSGRHVDKRVTSKPDPGDFIRPKLVFEGDKVAGFEVSAGRGAYQLAEFGLESGDIIRSIDGRPVFSDADWQHLTDALRKGDSVILGIDCKDSSISTVEDGGRVGRDADAQTPCHKILHRSKSRN